MGIGIGYEAIIFDEEGRYERKTGDRFISDTTVKVTEAEYIASAFGIKEVHEEMHDEKEEYELIAECDHKHTARQINKRVRDTEVQRVLNVLVNDFAEFRARWIPRVKNDRADAIARSAVERGIERELKT